MILLNSTASLEVLLAGAITTSQGVIYCAYSDMAEDGTTFAPGLTTIATNSTTAVTAAAAPASGNVRQVKYLSLYNADTASMTATVRVVDNSTNRILVKLALGVGERLEYSDGNGFRVLAADGALRSEGGGGSSSSRFVSLALSDMTTDLATGTAVAVWFAPEAGTLVSVFTGLHDPSSSGVVTVDMNGSGGSVFTTLPSIDATEATSLTGTPAVLDGTVSFAKGDKFTFDIDAAGTDAKGLQACVEYTPS